MSDQCLKCNHFNRPDMCIGEDCSIKESWYVLYLTQQTVALTTELKKFQAFWEQSRLTERVSFIRAYRDTKEATSEPENENKNVLGHSNGEGGEVQE